MCEEHRINGWWYLPSWPDARVPGVLTWTQEAGLELELMGGFPTQPDYERVSEGLWRVEVGERVHQQRTIYGETEAGKPMTLWEAELGNYKTGMTHQPLEQFWHSPWLCIGAHMPSVDAPALRSITVGLDNLYYLTSDDRFCSPRWANIEGVDNPGEEQKGGTFLLPYVLPVVGGLRAGWAKGSTNGATYFIDTLATRPPVTPATEAMPELKLDFMKKRTREGINVKLSVSARARIMTENDVFPPAEVPGRIKPLLDLIHLATYTAGAVTWITAVTDDDKDVVLLCHLGQRSDPDRSAQSDRVVFTLEDVPLGRFLDVRQRLSSQAQALYAWNVAVGMVGHSPRLVEEHVSQALAAAEGFHRWCLKGSGGTALRSRLVELHNRLPRSVKKNLGLDLGKWADWSVWARNHVAHGGANKHREVGDFHQMKVISDSVHLVTYLAILTELNVPEEKINEALLNHPKVSVQRNRCGELVHLPDIHDP